MRISDITTRDHLGGENITNNSYVLVNYASSANASPVTNKVTIHELAQAIACDLQLCKWNSDDNAIDGTGYDELHSQYASFSIPQTATAIVSGEPDYTSYYTTYVSEDGELAYIDASNITHYVSDQHLLFFKMDISEYVELVSFNGQTLCYLPYDPTPPE